MRFITVSTIGAIALLSGAAHAGLEYADIGANDLIRLNSLGSTAGGNTFFENEFFVQDSALFGPTGSPRVFSFSNTLASADHPSISSATFEATHVIEVTENRFSWDWTNTVNVNVNDPIVQPDVSLSNRAEQNITTAITVTEAAPVRITLEGDVFTADGSTGLPNEILISLSSSLGSFSEIDFSLIGSGSDSLTFEFDASAGEVIDLQSLSQSVYINFPGFNGDIATSQSGSISIEIVPAPATAALFGLSGLAAVRRRR